VIGSGILARRYARAMFDLGHETGATEAFLEQIDSVAELAREHRDLARVLFTPLHPREQRRAVLQKLGERLTVRPEVRAFLMILVEENRSALLPQIRDALREMVNHAAGRLTAQVTSARPLSDADQARLRTALSTRLRAQVTLEIKVDPSLIGGVVARVGDLLLDGSVRTQLASLAGSLRKGAQ